MLRHSALIELFRWGYAQVPGIIFHYAKELDLDVEDIGILSTVFYTLERTKPLYQTGIQIGQVLQACPFLTKHKLSRRLAKLSRLEIIRLDSTSSQNFSDRVIALEPLMIKLENLLIRDHIQPLKPNELQLTSAPLDTYEMDNNPSARIARKIAELAVAEEKELEKLPKLEVNKDYERMADFIARKTGNLMSVKMGTELRKWLDELKLAPEFLLCVLELCFERKIYNPREITIITKNLKEASICTLEGLETYFCNFVDQKNQSIVRVAYFDPDMAEFGNHTGIDMNAEARKKTYCKWRYDWGFSHLMIMKAGEIMCKHTNNGGMEYIDSVLHDWMSKEIRQIEEVDKQISSHKSRNKSKLTIASKKAKNDQNLEYELFIPPSANK